MFREDIAGSGDASRMPRAGAARRRTPRRRHRRHRQSRGRSTCWAMAASATATPRWRRTDSGLRASAAPSAPNIASTAMPLSARPSITPIRRRGCINNAGTTDQLVPDRPLRRVGRRNFFAQAFGGFGWQNTATPASAYSTTSGRLRTAPPSSPAASSAICSMSPGFRIGPIGGVTYARASHGYTETGDAALTLMVGSQMVDALVGSVGAQFRFPFLVEGTHHQPVHQPDAENDFIGNGRLIQFGATSAPLIVNNCRSGVTATRLWPRRRRRAGAGVEHRRVDDEPVAHPRPPRRRRFLRQWRAEDFVLREAFGNVTHCRPHRRCDKRVSARGWSRRRSPDVASLIRAAG